MVTETQLKRRERDSNNRAKLNAYQREWSKNNKDKVNKIKRKQMKKLKILSLTHYGGNPPKCACCGENNVVFLTIDHINGNGNNHRKEIGGNGKIYQWLKSNNFPDGFQVLCRNCNWAKHRDGCPHKSMGTA